MSSFFPPFLLSTTSYELTTCINLPDSPILTSASLCEVNESHRNSWTLWLNYSLGIQSSRQEKRDAFYKMDLHLNTIRMISLLSAKPTTCSSRAARNNHQHIIHSPHQKSYKMIKTLPRKADNSATAHSKYSHNPHGRDTILLLHFKWGNSLLHLIYFTA